MPKRSPKRKLNGLKLRRLQLAILPEVFDEFTKIAGRRSYNVTFEEMIRYVIRRMEKKQNKETTHSI